MDSLPTLSEKDRPKPPRPQQVRIGTLMGVVAGVAVCLAALRLPGGIAIAIGIAATLVLGAIALGLGWLGFGLFALGDWLIAWVGRAGSWPEEREEPRGF